MTETPSWRILLPGLGLAALIALLALALSNWPVLQHLIPLSPLMLAIVLGAGLGNSWRLPSYLQPGLIFSFKKVLRFGIILLGFKISLAQVQSIGWQGLFLLTGVVSCCFLFTVWLGKKLGLSEKLSLLLASGTSICGASAIVATDAVINAEEQECAYAIGAITLFGTLAMILEPLLQVLLHLSPQRYGLWVGSSIHEVAQAVAAGFAHGEQTGQLASLVKLTRVVYLVPVTLLLLVWNLFRTDNRSERLEWKKIPIPWFVFGFLGVILLNSLALLPSSWTTGLVQLDQFLLTLSMAALGIETRLDKLKATGLKPLYLGLASSLFISGLALGLIVLLYR